MIRKLRIVADAGQIVRAVGISALAIALAVYALVLQERTGIAAVLGAIIVLVSISAMLQVSRAVRKLHRQEVQTRLAARRAEEHYFQVLCRVLTASEAREPHTRGRSQRVGALARQIGEAMGLDGETCRLLDMAGQVQDIGMITVSESILDKPARLGDGDRRIVRKHAETSYRILEPLGFLAPVLPGVRHHHERMNGTGYPHGVAGDAIPLTARILAVADAFDAMTHDRPHRSALTTLAALQELRRCSPAGYDPACVTALETIMHVGHLQEAHDVTAPAAELVPAT